MSGPWPKLHEFLRVERIRKKNINLHQKRTTREDSNMQIRPLQISRILCLFNLEKPRKPEVFFTCQLAHPKRPPYMLRWPRRVSAASVGQLPTTSPHDIGHAHRESDEKVARHVMHLPGHIGLGFWSGWLWAVFQINRRIGSDLGLSATFKEWWKDQQTNPNWNQPFCWYRKKKVRQHSNGSLPTQTQTMR